MENKNPNPDKLPLIEETSLHHIVLRVRDWQETIDKKFGRKEACLEFENEEVNAYKKQLLEKGEVDENGEPVDRLYEILDEYGSRRAVKRFWLVREFEDSDIEDYEKDQEKTVFNVADELHLWRDEQIKKSENRKYKKWLDISKFCQYSYDHDQIFEDYVLEFKNLFIEKIKCRNPLAESFAIRITDSNIDRLDLYEANITGVYFSKIIAEKIDLGNLNLTQSFGIYNYSEIKRLEMDIKRLEMDLDASSKQGNIQITGTKIDFFYVQGSVFKCEEFCIWESFIAHLEIVNSIFKKDCKFLVSSRNYIGISIYNTCFYGEFVLLNTYLIHNFNITDVYFKNRVDLEIEELNANVKIINHEDKILNSEEPKKTIGKVFQDVTTLEFDIKKVKEGARAVIDYCDFTKLDGGREALKKLLATTDENGQKIVTLGKNCEPKPFQKVWSFKSDQKIATFMQDFVSAFKEYIHIRQSEDIFINVESTDTGYNIIFESNSESLITEIKEYKKDFEDFLKNPTSQFAILDRNLDKIENYIELMSLFNKIVVKLQFYKKLQISVEGESAFTLPNTEIINNLSFNMPNIKNQFTNSTLNSTQFNQADTISNPVQNNGPSIQELLQVLDKLLTHKAKSEEEKEALENIQQAKVELENGNQEKAKSFLKKA